MGGRFCVGVKNQRMLEEGNPISSLNPFELGATSRSEITHLETACCRWMDVAATTPSSSVASNARPGCCCLDEFVRMLGTIRAALPLVGGAEERLPYNFGRVTQGSAREKPSR